MCGKEEIIIVAENGEGKVPQAVQKCIVRDGDASFPNLITPVNSQDTEMEQKRIRNKLFWNNIFNCILTSESTLSLRPLAG